MDEILWKISDTTKAINELESLIMSLEGHLDMARVDAVVTGDYSKFVELAAELERAIIDLDTQWRKFETLQNCRQLGNEEPRET